MDSLTQIVLGASVGEAVLGKKVGNRAALWGGICGTIPDLDVLANIWMGELDALVAHRGVTHSIAFSIVMAPIVGHLIHRMYKKNRGSPKEWSLLAFWALLTHPLLDCFTSWGTQLFYPFSNVRVAFNTIFVADPAYTVPFLLCLLIALFLHREKRARRIWNWAGIAISSLYLLITVTNKMVVDAVFTNSLHRAGKSVERFSTYPTPLNNILWYVVAQEPSGYSIGLYSLATDYKTPIEYTYVPNQHPLIEGLDENEVVETLQWVSKGYFAVEESDSTLLWHDLRFGLMNLWDEQVVGPPKFLFSYQLIKKNGEYVDISQANGPPPDFPEGTFGRFWNRIWGRE